MLLSLTVFWLGAMKIKDSVEEMALVLFHNFDLPEEVTVGRSRYEWFYNERKSKSKTCCVNTRAVNCVSRVFKQEQEDTATSSTEYQKRIYRVSADIFRVSQSC